MHRAYLVAVVFPLLLTLGGEAEAAQHIAFNVTFPNGSRVHLVVSGRTLTGSGQMTAGASVRYPMSVTSGTVNGNYITLYGVIQGSSSRAFYRLVVNKASGFAQWTVSSGTPTVGNATVSISY